MQLTLTPYDISRRSQHRNVARCSVDVGGDGATFQRLRVATEQHDDLLIHLRLGKPQRRVVVLVLEVFLSAALDEPG